jgi:Calcineurin-like phosphoesterase
MKNAHRLPTLLCAALALALTSSCTEEPDDPDEEHETFTLVALPDTQIYADDYPEVFLEQTRWIVDNLETENIAFVTHLGDVVDNGPSVRQWENAREALSLLDDANVPYGVAMGNHDNQYSDWEFQYPGDVDDSCSDNFSDIDCTAEHFLQYAGPSFYQDQPWFGGASPSQWSHYSTIDFEGFSFLFLHLHADPRGAEVEWAQGVLDAHPDALVHVSTHRWLFDYRIVDIMPDPLPLLEAGHYNTLVHSMAGEGLYYNDSRPADQLFEDFIASNPNIYMVQCGHVDAEYRQESTNDAGLPVFEILTDFQLYHPDGGDGWMKLLTFDVYAGTIDVRTYSPHLDEFRQNGDGLDVSLEALADGLNWFGGYLEQFGLDPDELEVLLDYWTNTEQGRAEYYEAAYGDGQRDSEFVLEVDFSAYASAQ